MLLSVVLQLLDIVDVRIEINQLLEEDVGELDLRGWLLCARVLLDAVADGVEGEVELGQVDIPAHSVVEDGGGPEGLVEIVVADEAGNRPQQEGLEDLDF